MQFKHPEILYFLFLLIVPILVHLFQLRKFKKEYFTNVRFLKEISIQTRKSSKIKKWLLLCCRLLLLTFLIIAFAQPFYEAKETKNKENELFIVLDNSFSMQAKGQKGVLLKRAVQEILEYTPQNQQFSLITNDETFWNTDIKSIQNELQNLKYSAIPFELESVLTKIKSRKSTYKKEVIFITDAIGLNSRQLKSIDDSLIPFFIIPKAEQKNNVAIDSVYIDRNLNDFYKIGVKIVSFGEVKKDISVALYNNNKLIAKTVTKLEQKEKTLFFNLPKTDFEGFFSIDDIGLEYDNTLFFSISKPKKCRVLSIGEKEKSTFLNRIYTKEEFDYTNYEIENLDYNGIENQNTIILNELNEIPQSLKTTLKSFVEKGGNLIFIPAEKLNIENTNEFLKKIGVIQFKSIQNKEKLITKIKFNHPLYANVFENKVENFQYPKTSVSYEFFGSIPSILNYEDQTPFLVSIDKTFSSVYIFTAPINLKNSNFQQSPLIVPTFYKMAISKSNTALNALKIGEHLDYFIEGKLSKEQVLKISNKTEQFIPLQQIVNGKVKLTFNDLPLQAGNFRILDGQIVLANLSFNYNRSESDLTTNNDNLVSNYKMDSLKTVFDTLQTNRTESQIWKWFVIFALLFIVAEIAILRFIK